MHHKAQLTGIKVHMVGSQTLAKKETGVWSAKNKHKQKDKVSKPQ